MQEAPLTVGVSITFLSLHVKLPNEISMFFVAPEIVHGRMDRKYDDGKKFSLP